jgi:RNA polymerase sigma factor (sigma-70 family)
MEVSALKYSGGIGLHGRSPLLRLQSDERLITFVRKGNMTAFEVLVSRYESRLLSFCRHLLGSREDAEDVLQEVLAAAFNAILADDRPINVRPWLYRIARNRSLNHLRRIQAVGVDSMDVHFIDNGASTADKVHEREEFRLLVGDIHSLPETQKTALVLREMDALSYEQIAEAMETTVASVKSLLVRARVSLAEAAEARLLSCDEVRMELGEIAEGLRRRPSPLVRRHLKACARCDTFRLQLKETNKALAALMPIGPLVLLKKLALAHLGHSAGAGSGATAAGSTAAVGSTAAAGTTAGGFISAGVGAIATKAAAGLAVTALVTAGAVEVSHVSRTHHVHAPAVALVHQAPPRVPEATGGAPLPTPRLVHQIAAKTHKPAAKKTTSVKRVLVAAVPAKPTVKTDAKGSVKLAVRNAASTQPPGRTQSQTDPTVLTPAPIAAASTTTTTTATAPASTTPTPTTAPVLPAPATTTSTTTAATTSTTTTTTPTTTTTNTTSTTTTGPPPPPPSTTGTGTTPTGSDPSSAAGSTTTTNGSITPPPPAP